MSGDDGVDLGTDQGGGTNDRDLQPRIDLCGSPQDLLDGQQIADQPLVRVRSQWCVLRLVDNLDPHARFQVPPASRAPMPAGILAPGERSVGGLT